MLQKRVCSSKSVAFIQCRAYERTVVSGEHDQGILGQVLRGQLSDNVANNPIGLRQRVAESAALGCVLEPAAGIPGSIIENRNGLHTSAYIHCRSRSERTRPRWPGISSTLQGGGPGVALLRTVHLVGRQRWCAHERTACTRRKGRWRALG